MDARSLQKMIEDNIATAHVAVSSPDNVHYEAVVVSDAFEGLLPVKRQQMVYAALGNTITSGEVHALSLKTYTTAQWQDRTPEN